MSAAPAKPALHGRGPAGDLRRAGPCRPVAPAPGRCMLRRAGGKARSGQAVRSGPGTSARLPSPDSLLQTRICSKARLWRYFPSAGRQDGIGTMDQIAVLLAPGHVPDELGGSYEDACAALELPPVPGGYALYLLDQMNQRQTIISTDTPPSGRRNSSTATAGTATWTMRGWLPRALLRSAADAGGIRGRPALPVLRPLTRPGSVRARTLRFCSGSRCSASGASRVRLSAAR